MVGKESPRQRGKVRKKRKISAGKKKKTRLAQGKGNRTLNERIPGEEGRKKNLADKGIKKLKGHNWTENGRVGGEKATNIMLVEKKQRPGS